MKCASLMVVVMLLCGLTAEAAEHPNIVLIYADDLGYGDASCYGAERVTTPHIDRLAAEGLRFTDAHSPAATCTPSRYSLLTGEYAWRKPGTGILRGNANLIIEPGRTTLASILQRAGYATGVVGKWHLRLGRGEVDWNGEIKPGPLEVGFDYCFLVPATGDRVPCVYVENHHVVGLDPNDPIQVSYAMKVGDDPTGRENPDLLKMKFHHGHDQTIVNGISRIGYMTGGNTARWVDEDMADVLAKKATRFVEDHRDGPFFLFFSAHDIHVPRAPNGRFVGRSDCGTRGDVIVQLDWCVGEILAALDRLDLTENTLVVFTSDNGPVLNDGYYDGAVENRNSHEPGGPYRGGKYSNFEAGTRVPFIVRWPARVSPGISDALIGQTDLPATMAALVGQPLEANDAPDSYALLPALLGESREGRDLLVEQAQTLSLRRGTWKFIAPGRGPKVLNNTEIESGVLNAAQLYDLAADPGETVNVAQERPELAAELAEQLEQIRTQGRSRP